MLASTRTHETPILILLHARYQKFMRNMESFTFWYDAENNEFPRTLLLIDELPHMFDDNATNLSTLNAAEVELDQLKASYRYEEKQQKQDVLFHWNKDVRTPFFRLMRIMQKKYRSYGLVSHNDILEAGFSLDSLEELQEKLSQYATGTLAEKIVTAIQSADTGYFTIDQTTSLMLPQLILPDMISHLSTFIFSGTATLSPEVTNNPDVYMLPTNLEESYDRLKIYIQRGDDFTASKTGLVRQGNLQAVISWLKYIIPQCAQAHRKILLVTYKSVSEILWWQLKEFHDILIPYTDRSGSKAEKLPYFGGLNGSNLYQQATCVICVGLNRFEPREYLSRTLALDHVGTVIEDIRAAMELSTELRLDQLPSVLKTQDITLARDIVQLVFRSALRRHGESTPIDLWLLHPPNGVIGHLQDYFKDCHIEEINVLPESCHRAAVISKTYTGKATHAAVLLDWLCQWNGNEITPLKIREATGLTQKQFKEAKKHPAVREFFSAHIATHGSGQHTWYSRKAATDSTATVA